MKSEPWSLAQRTDAIVTAKHVALEKMNEPGTPQFTAGVCQGLIQACDAMLAVMTVPCATMSGPEPLHAPDATCCPGAPRAEK